MGGLKGSVSVGVKVERVAVRLGRTVLVRVGETSGVLVLVGMKVAVLDGVAVGGMGVSLGVGVLVAVAVADGRAVACVSPGCGVRVATGVSNCCRTDGTVAVAALLVPLISNGKVGRKSSKASSTICKFSAASGGTFNGSTP